MLCGLPHSSRWRWLVGNRHSARSACGRAASPEGIRRPASRHAVLRGAGGRRCSCTRHRQRSNSSIDREDHCRLAHSSRWRFSVRPFGPDGPVSNSPAIHRGSCSIAPSFCWRCRRRRVVLVCFAACNGTGSRAVNFPSRNKFLLEPSLRHLCHLNNFVDHNGFGRLLVSVTMPSPNLQQSGEATFTCSAAIVREPPHLQGSKHGPCARMFRVP